MKKSSPTLASLACGLLVLVLAPVTSAQVGRGSGVPVPKRDEARKALTEASKILDRARSSGEAESRKRTEEDSAAAKRIQELAAAALKEKDETPSAEEKAMKAQSDAQLDQALSTVAPEGQVLLAQSTPPPEKPQPVQPQVLSTDGSSVRPVPLKPTPLDGPAKDQPARTIITAVGPDAATFFDSSQALGVFTGDVEVTHPQFHMTCEILEVYMVKEDENKKTGAVKPAAPTASELAASGAATAQGTSPAGGEQEGSNIKQAIAKGRKVVIQKLSETGEMQIGICRHATYVGATGDMIMRNMPQVQRGTNLILATDPSTVMTILANGQLKVNGPATTKIIQEPEKKKPGAAASNTTTTPGGAPQ